MRAVGVQISAGSPAAPVRFGSGEKHLSSAGAAARVFGGIAVSSAARWRPRFIARAAAACGGVGGTAPGSGARDGAGMVNTRSIAH